jgi:hypothetical protein
MRGALLCGTCAHDSSEDPALAVFDRLVPAFEPLLQNGHTPAPVQGASATAILALPLALHHAPVIVAVHLGRGGMGLPPGRIPTLGTSPQSNHFQLWTIRSVGAMPCF